MVTEMVRVDLEVVAKVWDARGTRDFAYSISVDGNSYRFVFLENIRYCSEFPIIVDEADAWEGVSMDGGDR